MEKSINQFTSPPSFLEELGEVTSFPPYPEIYTNNTHNGKD